MRRGVFYTAVIVTIVLALVAGIKIRTKRSAPAKKISEGVAVKDVRGEYDIQNVFTKVADKVGKAVVSISTERTQRKGIQKPPLRFKRFGQESPFREGDPLERFFEEFFGRFPEREFKQRGLGSGFIIDKKGHILTNYHVVESAEKISVTLPDGRNFEGTVQGADPRSDIAVVKISAKNLPAVELGNSDLVQVGEWVVALGNPFGHMLMSAEPTVTVGVVSALHRRIPAPGGERGYLDMIQTDAAINPGNSGGPLCDLNGEVIGINVAMFSTSGGYQGVGFAIPIGVVKGILGDLVKGKEIAYGWLGVSVQDLTPEIADYFGLPGQKGALISQVIPDSPAEKDELKEGDIIVSFNGKQIAAIRDLLREVGNAKIGQIAHVGIIRDKARKIIQVKIGKRPSKTEPPGEEKLKVPEESRKWRGIRVANITDDIARDLGVTDKQGVVIMEIDPRSPAYSVGLRRGDILRGINRIRIKSVADYERVTREAKGTALARTERGYFTIEQDEEGQDR